MNWYQIVLEAVFGILLGQGSPFIPGIRRIFLLMPLSARKKLAKYLTQK